jgi:hypothetical protein
MRSCDNLASMVAVQGGEKSWLDSAPVEDRATIAGGCACSFLIE